MEALPKILERLNQRQVEYVLVGGLAAVLHGVTLVTRDVDVCLPFTEEDLARLEQALADLHPVHRMTPQRLPFVLERGLAARLKNLYLQTDLGVLDCIGEVAGIGDYPKVKRRSVMADLPVGSCRVLSIPALIESKQALNRAQDKLAVIQLRAILDRPAQP